MSDIPPPEFIRSQSVLVAAPSPVNAPSLSPSWSLEDSWRVAPASPGEEWSQEVLGKLGPACPAPTQGIPGSPALR